MAASWDYLLSLVRDESPTQPASRTPRTPHTYPLPETVRHSEGTPAC